MVYDPGMSARPLVVSITLLAAAGCATGEPGGPAPWRDPAFRPSALRRPAVFLQVSLERIGLGSGPFSSQERASIPERYESAVQEALNGLGILPVDLTFDAKRSVKNSDQPLDGLDLARALARARATGADHLVVLDARLSRRDLLHCRDGRRALVGTTTFWEAGLEVLRVSDGTRLLLEPPGDDQRVLDIEVDCRQGRLIRRKGMDEMIEESVKRAIAPLSRP